jgi:effector-binding domain-containing protein
VEDISLQELGITHKKIDKIMVAYSNFRGEIEDISAEVDSLYKKCKNYISGPPIGILDYGVYSEGGQDIEVCFPIQESIELSGIKTKELESVEVLSKMHVGPSADIDKSFEKLITFIRIHGITGTSWIRLVYRSFSGNLKDNENLESNKIEIQVVLHKWDDRLTYNLDRVLGKQVRTEIMKDREKLFQLESSMDERFQWVKGAIDRLDKLAGGREKYEILSSCAHEFSQKRIDKMRAIYEKNKNIDDVIEVMHNDYAWYEDPVRKGNSIYVTKIPYNREGYEKATTLEDKKKNYCHCPIVRNYLNSEISPTFCNCSTGWYRQLWEGIIGKSVQIDILKSLINGDDKCEFEIHLPKFRK